MASVFALIFACMPILTLAQDSTINFYILEQLPRNSPVGNVATETGLQQNMSAAQFSSLRYKFLNQADHSDKFLLTNHTGELTTNQEIDREEICGFLPTCVLKFDVAVSSQTPAFFEIYTVQIFINDTNDKIPVFPNNTIHLKIPEDDGIGTLYKIPSAVDEDIGINSVQGYSIIPSNGTFGINVTKNLDNSLRVRVALMKTLDREVQNFYRFLVMAKDGGSPPFTGTLTVDVNVQDVNDNDPIFTQTSYHISIKENIDVDTIILQCLATDKDINDNGRITYSFSPHQSELDLIKEKFSINAQTGEIKVIAGFDYGIRNKYTFYVEARDQGPDSRASQTFVNISITDAGNNPPSLLVNFLLTNDGTSVTIPENSKTDTAIAHINVQDSDTGPNGEVLCTMEDPLYELQPVTNKRGYLVVVKVSPDRETESTHKIAVLCHDNGSPPLLASANFSVIVSDQNDNTPEFTKNVYEASIVEMEPAGFDITKVTALDLDKGNNALIHFYLHGDSVLSFKINNTTGVISTTKQFDRETNPQVVFKVIAVDSGTPQPLTGTATVVLNVTDINDNKPRFNATNFQFYVLENMEKDTKVDKLTAVDLDDGQNGQMVFSLYGSDSLDFPFYVEIDGTIRTKYALDREQENEYNFFVEVQDLGSTSLNSTAHVTIIVADDNDNDPVILFPNDGNSTVSIPYLSPVGTVITKIIAYDNDSDANARLSYFIKSGNSQDVFDMDSSTGQLRLTNTFLIKEDTVFELDIEVKDGGRYPRSVSRKLHVVLVYSNTTSVLAVLDDSGNKYVIISVVVVLFTVFVSIIIITIIFLLRRSDKKLAKELSRQEKIMQANSYDGLDSHTFQNDGEKYPYTELMKKKKKEVSFSLDEDLDKSVEFASVSTLADMSKEQQFVAFQNSHGPNHQKLKSLQFDQFLIRQDQHAPNNKQKSILQKTGHDSSSDTSTEMTTSDSGRGGSDVDVHMTSNLPDDEKHDGFPSYSRSISEPSKYRDVTANKDNRFTGSPRPTSDVFSISSSKQRDYTGLTPRETFERKHRLTSSVQDNKGPSRPRSEGWSPSYV